MREPINPSNLVFRNFEFVSSSVFPSFKEKCSEAQNSNTLNTTSAYLKLVSEHTWPSRLVYDSFVSFSFFMMELNNNDTIKFYFEILNDLSLQDSETFFREIIIKYHLVIVRGIMGSANPTEYWEHYSRILNNLSDSMKKEMGEIRKENVPTVITPTTKVAASSSLESEEMKKTPSAIFSEETAKHTLALLSLNPEEARPVNIKRYLSNVLTFYEKITAAETVWLLLLHEKNLGHFYTYAPNPEHNIIENTNAEEKFENELRPFREIIFKGDFYGDFCPSVLSMIVHELGNADESGLSESKSACETYLTLLKKLLESNENKALDRLIIHDLTVAADGGYMGTNNALYLIGFSYIEYNQVIPAVADPVRLKMLLDIFIKLFEHNDREHIKWIVNCIFRVQEYFDRYLFLSILDYFFSQKEEIRDCFVKILEILSSNEHFDSVDLLTSGLSSNTRFSLSDFIKKPELTANDRNAAGSRSYSPSSLFSYSSREIALATAESGPESGRSTPTPHYH